MANLIRCAPFLLAAAAFAQQPAQPLHLAFVGNLEQPRGKDFVAFLRAHYPRVDAVERNTCDPSRLRCADVVVLDWSQQDEGVSGWLKDKKAARHCPLGDLEHWDRPTVLIGSAGLNLAAIWNLPGTYG
jgi:hypothetical protein